MIDQLAAPPAEKNPARRQKRKNLTLSPAQVCRYEAIFKKTMALRLKMIVLPSAFFYAAFNLLDWVVYPALAPGFFLIRALVCLFLVAVYLSSEFEWYRSRIIVVCFGTAYLSALGIVLMIYLAGGVTSVYREGLYLIFIAFLFLNTFKTGLMAVFTGAICIAYFITCLFFKDLEDIQDVLTPVFFLGAFSTMIIIMTFFLSRQNIREFFLNEKIRDHEKLLETSYAKAKLEAQTDSLTQVYNRGAFLDILSRKIEVCRSLGKSFYLVFFDLDNFKQVNDVYGHPAGDELLRRVIGAVKNNLRAGTEIGRYGGDEFIFIIDEAASDSFLARVNTIHQAIAQLDCRIGSHTVSVSASFGAAYFNFEKMTDAARLIQKADEALLYVKQRGRGGIHLANKD